MLAAVFLNQIDLFGSSQATFGLPSQDDSRRPGLSSTKRRPESTTLAANGNGKQDGPIAATEPEYKRPAKLKAAAHGKAPDGLPVVSSGEITNPQVPDGSRTFTGQTVGGSAKPQLKAAAVVESETAKQLVAALPVNDQKAAVATLKDYVKRQKDGAFSYDRLLNIAVINNYMAQVDLLLSLRPHFLARPFVNHTEVLDLIMTTEVQKADTPLLAKLLNAHPYVHRDLLDRSFGTSAFNFFRKIGSWFGSDAAAWQRTQGIDLVRAAARTANTATMTLLLDRAIDLIEDAPEMEHALSLAISVGNTESTAVLLKAVLHKNPGYASNMTPTTIAAKYTRAGVLEVLVSNGMVLPPDVHWSKYVQPIEDYLQLKADDQRLSKGEPPALPLSRITLDNLVGMRSRLSPELRKSLNGKPESLKAQSACQLAGMFPDSGLPMITVEPFITAGFTTQTATGLVAQLNSNAAFHSNELGVRPLLNLAGKVAEAFEYFVVEGKVRANLLDYLREQGMHGLVADLVETAIHSAAGSAIWTMKQAEREMLLAEALIKTLGERQDIFEEASKASGDADAFAMLLNSQLKILEAHQLPYWPKACCINSAKMTMIR